MYKQDKLSKVLKSWEFTKLGISGMKQLYVMHGLGTILHIVFLSNELASDLSWCQSLPVFRWKRMVPKSFQRLIRFDIVTQLFKYN